jgi:hypothetical protein
MPIPLDAQEVLNREFLEIRAGLLQIAASLDRLTRAEGSVAADPRLAGVRQALEILAGDGMDRAEQIQLVFSRPYETDWRRSLAAAQKTSGQTRRAP